MPDPERDTVWSGAVLVMVALLDVAAIDIPVPAVNVTSVPDELFSVTGELDPVNERFVVVLISERSYSVAINEVSTEIVSPEMSIPNPAYRLSIPLEHWQVVEST